MSTSALRSLVLAAGLGMSVAVANAFAEVPRVATDILPIHSLVAQVMDGLGEPALVVPPGASPHGYAMRPSEARALGNADIVFWVGDALEPWFAGAAENLAADAVIVEMLEVDGSILHEFRDQAVFDPHEGERQPAGHDDDHDDHQESEPDAHGEDDGHDHAHHGDHDPHAWLDPENGKLWLDAIADELSRADPANSDLYRENARRGMAAIDAAVQEARTVLAPVRGNTFVVFHDAYQYFEKRFELPVAAAISAGDGSAPSPARLSRIRKRLAGAGPVCVFAEPQFNPGLVATVSEGLGANTVVIDPLGTQLAPGPSLYPALLRQMSMSVAGCF